MPGAARTPATQSEAHDQPLLCCHPHRALDVNNDGVLSLEEFKAALSTAAHIQHPQQPKVPVSRPASAARILAAAVASEPSAHPHSPNTSHQNLIRLAMEIQERTRSGQLARERSGSVSGALSRADSGSQVQVSRRNSQLGTALASAAVRPEINEHIGAVASLLDRRPQRSTSFTSRTRSGSNTQAVLNPPEDGVGARRKSMSIEATPRSNSRLQAGSSEQPSASTSASQTTLGHAPLVGATQTPGRANGRMSPSITYQAADFNKVSGCFWFLAGCCRLWCSYLYTFACMKG